ncbi:helix-turn-helix domain-containing protein [Streptomyces sp. NPDC002536]
MPLPVPYAHPQRLFSRDRLMQLVWQQSTVGEERTVDTHIGSLRRKLGPRYRAIVTSAGRSGYVLDPAKAAPRTLGGH